MRSIFYSGARDHHGSEAIRKLLLLNTFLLLGFVALMLMGVVALMQNAKALGITDFVMSAVFFSLFYYLRRTGDEPTVSRFGVGLNLIFFSWLFFIGGVNTTSFVWLYTFPLFSLHLLGFRDGLWATGLLFTFCIGVLAVDMFTDIINVYSKDFAIRFPPSFLLVCLMAYLVENSRFKAHNTMLEKQNQLAGTIAELQQIEIELQEARNQLELRVALRTSELEKANVQLRIEIDERLWAEQERVRLESELIRAQKMELLGRLAGGVAHDLNNVLSGIVSYPDLLLMDLPPESNMQKPLENIKKAGVRAAAIVQDLLTLARRGISVKENVQLNDIVTTYLQSLEFITLQQNYPDVTVQTDLAANLQILSGSSVHLEKAVMNLLVNSFEAIENTGTIQIITENRRVDSPIKGYDTTVPGNYIVLTVSDDGVGIPQEKLDMIFEPFYSSKILGLSGTGLGMTVVWGTVKDHDGYLDVKSYVGSGTSISVFIPALEGSSEISQEVEPRPEVIEHGNRETILLVDDAPEQRALGNIILTTLGYMVETVDSGEEAVLFLENRGVDLVLLDMIMKPGMDGLDTYRNIQKVRPEQKVIIISGYSETGRIKKAMELGVRSYVTKPYSLEDIATVIRQVILEQ
jgi:signal transduction histidine kinase/ActR/RegA family two-component response regulator